MKEDGIFRTGGDGEICFVCFAGVFEKATNEKQRDDDQDEKSDAEVRRR